MLQHEEGKWCEGDDAGFSFFAGDLSETGDDRLVTAVYSVKAANTAHSIPGEGIPLAFQY